MIEDRFRQLLDLAKQRNDLEAAWCRQILTIAAGGMALLVGLGPAEPPTELGRWFLAAAWIFLGTGILAAGGATYLEVSLARRLAAEFRSQLLQDLQERKSPENAAPIVANAHWFFRFCKPLMAVSLGATVVCLVGYSVLVTLFP